MFSAALLTRYSQALLPAAPPIWPITLERKAKRPCAASTSGATCGITCIAPSTLACITRSKSCCVGGCVASARLHITPATCQAVSIFSPSSCQARPLTLAGLATSSFST